jgi:CRP-like cAMP-binding protein
VARLDAANGRLERRRRGQALGVLAALEQRPHAATCVCESAVQTLALPVADLFELLEDYFDLARALLAYLGEQTLKLRRNWPTLIDGDPCSGDGPLTLLERVVFLKSVPLLQGASVEQLARLAREADEVRFDAGEAVHKAGSFAAGFWVVLAGRLGAHGPRTSIGLIDVLAQRHYRETAIAHEPSYALRVPADSFFDLVEDHFDLLLRVSRDLGAMVRRLS